jgi:hypothetical protein
MSLNQCTFTIGISSAGETVAFGAVTSSPTFTDNAATTQLINGTGNGAAQHTLFAKLTTGTGGTTYDLNSGISGSNLPVGLDGAFRAFTGIKWIKIENLSTTDPFSIQGGASNPWAGVPANGSPLTLNPGDVWLRMCPNTAIAVDGTHKTILITAGSNTPVAAVSIIGLGT